MPNPDNPYGFTIFSANDLLQPQALIDVKALGATWIRWQLPWTYIENPQGNYNWSVIDDAVSKCNTAGVNIAFPLQNPPLWGLSMQGNPPTLLPDPTALASFAVQVAARYNGQNGHGHIDSIEIGNEEFDSTSVSNTTYPAIANASYHAIKNAGFTGLIGCCAMLHVISNVANVQWWVQNLYNGGVAELFDYLNFHYYKGFGLPPSISSATHGISFDAFWNTIHQTCIANNDPNRAIWITEIGYETSVNGGHSSSNVVSAAIQSQYTQYMLDSARNSGCIKKLFIYSIDNLPGNTDGKNITQGVPPNEVFMPCYFMLGNEIAGHPTWPIPTNYNPPMEVVTFQPNQTTTVILESRYAGDLLPSLAINLQDDTGDPIDLTNIQAIDFTMQIDTSDGRQNKNAGSGSFSILGNILMYSWGINDVSSLGTYNIQLKMEYPNGSLHFSPAQLTILEPL